MTMPSERTRALRWAGEFLREVMGSPERFSEELRREAKVILRHYPMPSEIKDWAKSEQDRARLDPLGWGWLGPEDDDQGDS